MQSCLHAAALGFTSFIHHRGSVPCTHDRRSFFSPASLAIPWFDQVRSQCHANTLTHRQQNSILSFTPTCHVPPSVHSAKRSNITRKSINGFNVFILDPSESLAYPYVKSAEAGQSRETEACAGVVSRRGTANRCYIKRHPRGGGGIIICIFIIAWIVEFGFSCGFWFCNGCAFATYDLTFAGVSSCGCGG